MAKTKNLGPVLAIIAGIIVIAAPAILAWIIGLYLIINGILDLSSR
ncbi:DUF3096 domain-containing protein [Candidatus Pacearchaeota archaeon]|nr:DUF3096 domain-containing protein [Candidatus Pacearchaeota archaeon]